MTKFSPRGDVTVSSLKEFEKSQRHKRQCVLYLANTKYMCQDEDDMKKLVANHDLDLFPLRVARAINQQVIAPAFAFLYSVVDMSRGKPFLDSRNG